jgi:hypothetical protein
VSAISLIRCEETKTVPALGSQALQEVPHPADALRIEPVHGLVEHHGRRVAEQRRGDPQPLAHPERELAGPLPRHVVQADQVDELVDAPARNPVRVRQREQMVVRRPAGVHRARLEQRSHLVQRRDVLAVVLAVHGDVAACRRVEAEDQSHRRRLPRAVRPQEAGDDSRPDRERQAVDRSLLAVVLRQLLSLDHVLIKSAFFEGFLWWLQSATSSRSFHFHAAGGIGIGFAGTSVATETCGQVRPLKFSMTVCEYWIWVVRILIT